MTITLAVLLGFALDWLLGDPKKLPHPVCAVGKLISGTEKVLRRIFPATPASLTFAGIVLWLITCGVSFAVPFFLLRWLYRMNFWLGFAAETLLCWMIFARKSLADAGCHVYDAVKQSLEKLSNEEVRVRVIHSAVGGITEGDVMFAAASNAIIVGFNVRPDKAAIDSADRQNVDIRTYRIIYECIEEISAAMKGMLAPEFKEVVLGHAEVRQTIHVPNVGTIAGSYVQDGKISRNAQIRIVRDGIVIAEDRIASLKRFKDDAREVAAGYECGVGLDKFNDIHEGDIMEAFIMEEVER